jgi:hypothetical protein
MAWSCCCPKVTDNSAAPVICRRAPHRHSGDDSSVRAGLQALPRQSHSLATSPGALNQRSIESRGNRIGPQKPKPQASQADLRRAALEKAKGDSANSIEARRGSSGRTALVMKHTASERKKSNGRSTSTRHGRPSVRSQFLVCIDNRYETSLEPNKILAIKDEQAQQTGDVRIVDESGEDLYSVALTRSRSLL